MTHDKKIEKTQGINRRYLSICQQTDADPETGYMKFDIEKGRFFRLTAP